MTRITVAKNNLGKLQPVGVAAGVLVGDTAYQSPTASGVHTLAGMGSAKQSGFLLP